MKKHILIIMLLILSMGALIGCSTEKDNTNEPVLPPVRYGQYSMEISVQSMSLSENMETLISAYIEIGNWLGEDKEYSYFDATVVEAINGDIPKRIVVRQYGSSFENKSSFPIFTYGNELFLFLEPVESEEYENLYRPYGIHLWVCDVAENEGVRYVLPRFMYSQFDEYFDNYYTDEQLLRKLENVLREKDPMLEYPYYGVFLYDDIVNRIQIGK